jgi:hypothetical protein
MAVAGHPTAIPTRIRAVARRSLRAAARMAHRSRSRLSEFGSNRGRRGAPFGSFRGVEGFYFAGGALAVWALVVSALGVMREDFPSTRGATRLVGAISIVLVVGAVGSAIYLSATEEHEPKGGEHAAGE